jgi:hypothetical protein
MRRRTVRTRASVISWASRSLNAFVSAALSFLGAARTVGGACTGGATAREYGGGDSLWAECSAFSKSGTVRAVSQKKNAQPTRYRGVPNDSRGVLRVELLQAWVTWVFGQAFADCLLSPCTDPYALSYGQAQFCTRLVIHSYTGRRAVFTVPISRL